MLTYGFVRLAMPPPGLNVALDERAHMRGMSEGAHRLLELLAGRGLVQSALGRRAALPVTEVEITREFKPW